MQRHSVVRKATTVEKSTVSGGYHCGVRVDSMVYREVQVERFAGCTCRSNTRQLQRSHALPCATTAKTTTNSCTRQHQIRDNITSIGITIDNRDSTRWTHLLDLGLPVSSCYSGVPEKLSLQQPLCTGNMGHHSYCPRSDFHKITRNDHLSKSQPGLACLSTSYLSVSILRLYPTSNRLSVGSLDHGITRLK